MFRGIFKRGVGFRFIITIIVAIALGLLFLAIIWRMKRGFVV